MNIKIDDKAQRVVLWSERFYTTDNVKFYPSVTQVLKMWSPEPYLIEWWKNNGKNSDILLREASERGTLMHNAIERLLSGNAIDYRDINRLDVWLMVVRFSEFMIENNVRSIQSELKMVSDSLRIGGTLDFICEMHGHTWLIDFKSSNNLQDTYHIQSAVYKEMYEEATGVHIDRTGILWLNAQTRGADRKGKKIQGAGWQLVEPQIHHDDLMSDWHHLRAIFDRRNPDIDPQQREYPSRLKLPSSHVLEVCETS